MRQVQLNRAWREGNFYPRWGADLAFGHGMPIFSYAPPFLYQLTQLFHLTGLPLDESMKATLIFDFLLYSAGMFLLARRLYGPAPALVAATLYVYAPYRLREAYIQGNYGQFSGLAFYPLIFWAFHALITDGRPRYLIAAALALAGLLFSHNISFMLFAPLFAAYLVFLLGLHFFQYRTDRFHLAGRRGERWGDTPQAPRPGMSNEQLAMNNEQSSTLTLYQPSNPSASLKINPPALQSSNPSASLRTGLPSFHSFGFAQDKPSIFSPLLRTTLAALLGLSLAAIFWLPAFGERHDIKLEGITQGFFDFRENFISLPELLSPPQPLDQAAINPEFPLSLGLAQIGGAGLGFLALLAWTSRRLRPANNRLSMNNDQLTMNNVPVSTSPSLHPAMNNEQLEVPPSPLPALRPALLPTTLFFTTFLLLYSFLALPTSQLLWETVPLLELAEFPWRMLGPAIFCASLLGAAGFAWLLQLPNKTNEQLAINNEQPSHPSAPSRTDLPVLQSSNLPILQFTLILAAIVVIIALNAHYLYPAQFISWGTPTPADGFAYEVSSGAIGTTSTGEFLPRWARQHPAAGTLSPDYAAGRPPQKLDPATLPAKATVDTLSHRSESDSLAIDTPAPFSATMRTLYWPGWQVYLNGQAVPLTITEPTGLIQLEIPAGRHRLDLHLESTPLRTAGLGLSLTAFVILFAVGVESLYRRSHNETRPQQPQPGPLWSSPKVLAVTTLALVALYFVSRPLEPTFVLRSDPNRPQPADRLTQADFGDQLRLVGLDDLPEVITLPATGSADLHAVLYWRALQPTDANYSIFLHLDAPNGETFATVDAVHPEDIPTRHWPPGLYLRHALQLKLPADLPPIRYDLTTGVYNRATGRRLPLEPGGATSYKLEPVWLERPAPQFATPTPLARFGDQITLLKAHWGNGVLRLLWQTDRPVNGNYIIFVHALDRASEVTAQADGVPYDGLYPLLNWRPGQLIEDIRSLPLDSRATHLAIGLYDPANGQRLPAVDAANQALADHSLRLAMKNGKWKMENGK
jgi:hypothetical protein